MNKINTQSFNPNLFFDILHRTGRLGDRTKHYLNYPLNKVVFASGWSYLTSRRPHNILRRTSRQGIAQNTI